MRIGLKLTLALIVPLVALTLFLGWLFQLQGRALLREELAREGRAISRVVAIATEDYLRDRQIADLRQLADRITGYERVLGLRLFDRDGTLTYQSSTLEPFPFRHWDELRRALAAGETVEMRRLVGDQPVLGFIVPLVSQGGGLLGAVQVLQLESYIAEDERATRDFILQLTVAMAAAIVVIVLLVTRISIGRPIARLVERFREVGARDVPARVPVRGDDELSWLTREFNSMCDRLHATRQTLAREQDQRRSVEGQLRDAERLAGLGRMAAGLAHEIGTPLNVILGRAESVQKTLDPADPAARNLGIVVAQSERIARIVRDMLDFARMKPRRFVATDLGATLRAALDLLERQCEQQGVRVETALDEPLPRVMGDPDQLQQVFLNLGLNALDAMPGGGTLRVEAWPRVAPPERGGLARRCVAVLFEDTGSGIAPDDLHHVFDPFFTTKDAGRGTGLGLSVSYGIIEEHGGWFEVNSKLAAGTRFTVFLPEAMEDGTAA